MCEIVALIGLRTSLVTNRRRIFSTVFTRQVNASRNETAVASTCLTKSISRRYPKPDWLTVDKIATELKVSKTIVYRLIRTGDLEAVNIVSKNGSVAKKGHYRIRRSDLNLYIESKRVRPFPEETKSCPRHFPKVKNHLGL